MDEGNDFVEVDGGRRLLRQLRKMVAMTLAEEIRAVGSVGAVGAMATSRLLPAGARVAAGTGV